MPVTYLYRLTLILTCCLLLGFVQESSAQVSDILKVLGNLYGINVDQLSALNDIKNVNERLKEVGDKQLAATTGQYHIGELFNSRSEQLDRLWSGATWQDLLTASGGNADRFRELLLSYQAQYPMLPPGQITPFDSTRLKAKTYSESGRTSLAGLSVSQYSYNTLQDRIKRLQGLLDRIDQTPNAKASSDLQARILAEIGFAQLELLRLQSVHTQLSALGTQGLVSGTTQDAKFVTW